MPVPFRPQCQPTSLGPLPHTNVAAAWDAVLRHTPALPALPLVAGECDALPLLAVGGFAGVEVRDWETVVDRAASVSGFDRLYANYLQGPAHAQRIELAAVDRLLNAEPPLLRRSRALASVLVGPITLALTVVDDQAVPLLNDVELLDALSKHLFLRRLWLQRLLERSGKSVMVWLYEPHLNRATWPFSPLGIDAIVSAVDQALGNVGPRALWLPDAQTAQALTAELRIDALAFPLPSPEQASLLAPFVARLVADKTAIGWGIVPVTSEGIASATVGRLAGRFERWLDALEGAGLDRAAVLSASLIMPEDTMAYLDPAEAERALSLTAELSSLIQQSYGVD
jgi:hypothetical protein